MCSILQSNSYDGIPKTIMGYNMLAPTKAFKKVDTQIDAFPSSLIDSNVSLN
jgi:hypothetical protein